MTALELAQLDDDGGQAPPPRTLDWSAGDARYDGHWWPQSDDAVTELTALLSQVEDQTKQLVTRVTLDMSEWSSDQPRRMRVHDHQVRLGWFPHLPEHTVTLGRSAGPRLVLHTHPAAELQVDPAASTPVAISVPVVV